MKPIKTSGKWILCKILEFQVKNLRKRHHFKVVAVAGSAGKTSTKFALAQMLSSKKKVLFQEGNYNDRLTVPLILFNHPQPSIFNIFAWIKIVYQNYHIIRKDYPYDCVVVELGTDGPGQIEKFEYLKPEIVVLVSIAEEHMEYFDSIDDVAKEEMGVHKYAKLLVVNIDDTDQKYLEGLDFTSYGLSENADYRFSKLSADDLHKPEAELVLSNGTKITVKLNMLGKQGAKICLAAAAVGDMLGYSNEDIISGLQSIHPVSGRLNVLEGKNGSKIIDDTYNASPIAVRAALDVLYATKSKQRIAVLGTMNELGRDSNELHKAIGDYCKSDKLDMVITIGEQAANYLAPAAKDQGCQVHSFNNPYEAGDYVAEMIKPGAVVLVKGSQNGVFAEEAVKKLLAHSGDAKKLVRQTSYWLDKKAKQFS
jgi:UDP-N-acetylmuramoyl-tripeptide--D-alanyl-D-alanine ligase